jgi:nucleotide-binding universal stress UspA family protein
VVSKPSIRLKAKAERFGLRGVFETTSSKSSGGEETMKLVAAYNGTKESKLALDLAKKHAKLLNARLLVIASSEGGKGERPEDIGRIKIELDNIKVDLENEGINGEVDQLARGLSPGEDIVLFAEENDIDQIYVGVRKKSRTSKLILGSTAQYIILKAKCPVISVK